MSKSSLRYIRDGKVLVGCLWREWAPVSQRWDWFGEQPDGTLRDFGDEADAEAWLWKAYHKSDRSRAA